MMCNGVDGSGCVAVGAQNTFIIEETAALVSGLGGLVRGGLALLFGGAQGLTAAEAAAAISLAERQGLRELFGQGPGGAQVLLDRLAHGPVSLPSNVTRQTLENYGIVAQGAINQGIDKIGTQALRLEAIRRLLGQ